MLEFLGREDGQVKVDGHRLELGEVEHALLALDGVTDVAVIAVGDPRANSRRLAAYLVCTGEMPQPGQLRERLHAALPGYAIPSWFCALPEIPLTSNGKVDRKALPRPAAQPGGPMPAAESAAGSRPAAPPGGVPAGELERKVADIWAVVLGADQVSAQSSFFDLGGTSVDALNMLNMIGTELRRPAWLADLFNAPTLGAFAALLAGISPGARPGSPGAPGDPGGPFPLTDTQMSYWIGRRPGLWLGAVAAHTYSEYDITDLEVGRLERAVNALVRRHGMLRAIFGRDGTQRILGQVPHTASCTPTSAISRLPASRSQSSGCAAG